MNGAYRSMEDALERIASDLPDVVLNDIGLPGMSGIDGIPDPPQRAPSGSSCPDADDLRR